jgi:hypothetical protein
LAVVKTGKVFDAKYEEGFLQKISLVEQYYNSEVFQAVVRGKKCEGLAKNESEGERYTHSR